MAFLSQQTTYPMRSMNKEPDWSSTYDDLFDQYIDTDQLDFSGSSDITKGTSNSDDSSSKIIDHSSASSCQPGSSPPYKWSAKESEPDFWKTTLRSLEESAAFLDKRGQDVKLVSPHDIGTALHSDFLSLGGWPSPDISAPPSPLDLAKRRKASFNSLRHCRSIPASKSPGVNKTYRSGSKSPKMMSPSRYKADFREVWTNKISGGSQTYNLTLPLRPAPLSPPPSAKTVHAVDAAAFCSPREIDTARFQDFGKSTDEIYPRTIEFQGTMRVQTPCASPLTSPGVERGNTYGSIPIDDTQDLFRGRSMYYAVPRTAPRSTRSSWLYPEDDDYELSPTSNPWSVAPTAKMVPDGMTNMSAECSLEDIAPFASIHPNATRTLANSGLMISCDPTFTTGFGQDTADTELAALPTDLYPLAQGHGGKRQQERDFLGCSSSPPLGQSPRTPQSRRASSRGRRRRTPSTPRSPRGTGSSSFVNFTPSDSAKLLTGVAPSGSSKTKARREREALEKRRKFSQAAVRAVTEAGGDVNRLRDVML